MDEQLVIRVLLIEDDRDLASSVADYLKYEGIVCDHAYNGFTGLNLACKESYDVILLDIMLPRMDGFSLCQKLRNEGVDTPILMLTAKDTIEDKEVGFNSGTDDYLVKPFAMKELSMRVKALAKRRSGQLRKLVLGDLILDLDTRSVTRAGDEIKLNRTSLNLLEILMRKSPNVVSKREIEEMLWPDDMPECNNLKVQLYKLRQQIDKPYEFKLIETVVGHGFRMRGKP